MVRELAGEKTGDLGAWWTEYQEADDERRSAMKQSSGQKRRRKRNRKKHPRKNPNEGMYWQP